METRLEQTAFCLLLVSSAATRREYCLALGGARGQLGRFSQESYELPSFLSRILKYSNVLSFLPQEYLEQSYLGKSFRFARR